MSLSLFCIQKGTNWLLLLPSSQSHSAASCWSPGCCVATCMRGVLNPLSVTHSPGHAVGARGSPWVQHCAEPTGDTVRQRGGRREDAGAGRTGASPAQPAAGSAIRAHAEESTASKLITLFIYLIKLEWCHQRVSRKWNESHK